MLQYSVLAQIIMMMLPLKSLKLIVEESILKNIYVVWHFDFSSKEKLDFLSG